MQKILYTAQVEQYVAFMDTTVINYIREGQSETFESFEGFNLLAFDWYDISQAETVTSKLLIYMDGEDLFFLCEDQRVYNKVTTLLPKNVPNERALYLFFVGLLKNNMNYLERFEGEITNTEDDTLKNSRSDYVGKIMSYRKELLRLKRYYEQLSAIFDNLVANDNNLLSRDGERHFGILSNRTDRFYSSVLNIRDYITQMREAYQAQIDIEQNKLMKIFTLITAVFLPLTLLVGWYGMNFEYMPELTWRYGYITIIGFSIVLSMTLVIYFKRKKWF